MITVRQADTKIALNIMKEAAEWLLGNKMPLWQPADFIPDNFLKSTKAEDVYTAYIQDTPVAAMILQWADPTFWPDSDGDSGFIHKLSIRREFAGRGIPKEFIEWAKDEVRKRNRQFLRLDCAGDRPKLCKIYEDMGFFQVERKMMGPYDVALYEINV
jgi:GNAT superfamily N-acetyltransferase